MRRQKTWSRINRNSSSASVREQLRYISRVIGFSVVSKKEICQRQPSPSYVFLVSDHEKCFYLPHRTKCTLIVRSSRFLSTLLCSVCRFLCTGHIHGLRCIPPKHLLGNRLLQRACGSDTKEVKTLDIDKPLSLLSSSAESTWSTSCPQWSRTRVGKQRFPQRRTADRKCSHWL